MSDAVDVDVDRLAEWLRREIGARSIRPGRILPGGTHARTRMVTVDGVDLVVRVFPVGDDAVRMESPVLDALAGSAVPAPRPIAADPHGEALGAPTIVTSMLPGSSHLEGFTTGDRAEQFGRALALVHDGRAPADAPDLLAGKIARPGMVGLWPELGGPDVPRVLSHGDFWSGNTLWSRDGSGVDAVLTGVVDWSGAGIAPRGYDVSWARQDLILLDGERVADAFTRAYEEAAGVRVDDLHGWDLFAAASARPRVEEWAPNYQDLGRHDLDGAELRRRLTAWMRVLDGRSSRSGDDRIRLVPVDAT